jgi:hypothetical protein
VSALPQAAVEGDTKTAVSYAARSPGMVRKEQAAPNHQEIFEEAEALLRGAPKWVG